MNVYISAHAPNVAELAREELEALGHRVTSTWHLQPGLTKEEWFALTPKQLSAGAERNMEQIERSQALLLVACPDHAKGIKRHPGGKFVEAGFALGSGLKVFVLGGCENGMMRHPGIKHITAFTEVK